MALEFVIRVTAIGLFAGAIGTGGGGFISYCLLRKPNTTLLSTVLGFSAGVMLAIVFMDLLPESILIAGHGTRWSSPGRDRCAHAFRSAAAAPAIITRDRQFRFRRYLLGVRIAYIIYQGLAIGRLCSSISFGRIALMMTMQNIPEGMAMATAMYGSLAAGGGITGYAGRVHGYWHLDRAVGRSISSHV